MDSTYTYRGAKVNISKDLVTNSYYWGIQLDKLIGSYGPFSNVEVASKSANSWVDLMKEHFSF